MKILCFGTLAEVMRVCCRGYVPGNQRQRNEIVPQTKLVGELLNAIDTIACQDWTTRENASQLAMKLLKCKQGIPDNLKPSAATITAGEVSQHIKEVILPLSEKPEILVLAIRDIIREDTHITDSIIATLFSMESKQILICEPNPNLLDFITNAFICAIRIDNKLGKDCIAEITEAYVLGFAAQINQIFLDTSSLVSTSNAVRSLRAQRSLFDMEVSNEFTPPLHD